MALTQTLFTGMSGLDTNQTRLNVVGNNIANVNTVGFKSSRALFKPQFYVTDSNGSPPGSDFGGTNPSQRGLGATVASIEKDFSAGSIEPTGKNTDLAIEGDGFFVVESGGEERYTRDGSFQLNQNNELVTSSGSFVQGWTADDDGNIQRGTTERLQIPLGGASKARATETVAISGQLNTGGKVASGATILGSVDITDGGALPTNASPLTNITPAGGGANLFAAGDVLTLNGLKGNRSLGEINYEVTNASTVGDLRNFFQQGLGIDDSQPSAGTLTAGTEIEDTSGAGTFGRLTILGNRGEANALKLTSDRLTSDNPNFSLGFTEQDHLSGVETGAVGESITTSVPVFDSLGTPSSVDVTLVLEDTTGNGTTWRYFAESADDTDYTFSDLDADAGRFIASGTVNFDVNGKVTGRTDFPINIDRTDTGSGDPLSISLDFTKVSAVAAPTGTSSLAAQGDGIKAGTLTDFGIGENGIITGKYSNGLTENIGQITMAIFQNPLGLEDEGGNEFRSGANSGDPQLLAPTEGLGGSLRSGSLELSNVDLSKEFINMIISSTGFSAASRVISTSDELLTELINSTR